MPNDFPSLDGGVQLTGAMYGVGEGLSFHTANRAYPIQTGDITKIEVREDDPVEPEVGRVWMRSDIS